MTMDTISGLAGKVVVVTGAAGGQGLAESQILADNGAIVVALDLQPERSAELEAISRGSQHPGSSDRLIYRRHDVSIQDDWSALARELHSLYGHIDGLVNNAGISWRARLGDIEIEDWNRVIGVNLTGSMLGIQAMLPLMRPGASIVNVGSLAGITAHHTVAYTVSKWGLRGLSAVAATALGPRGIRSNIVHPGYIDTPMMVAVPPVMKSAQLSLTPLGRVGEAQDVARVVAYLISDLSSYVTGAEIPIDGGFSASSGAKIIADAIEAAT